MREKIEEILKTEEGVSLAKISKDLGISFIEVLRQAPVPTVRKYDVSKLDELFDILRSWEKVFLLVVTPSFVLEIKDKFPRGFYSHGFLNFHDETSSIGGHLSASKIKEIFVVEDMMYGRKSCSIKFYGEDEKEIFAIYVPRDEKKELIKECLESFNKL
ncbi:putative heme utilization carrier protein HutX [Fusobacterium sp. PH5-7]|uniref:heme utilization cystosolic carrier protein HutX n=1 Tax=Fusobacterium sp. PH5-7 TaxID=2940528 RepID=UPI002474778A|nr:heme utilization cystosolic carrier protein HutX [Fusobacterium sp. PH5-7]MDH6459310.1 putative heme utilization carrier protein HutX [Fusobacterium sp. PH5-7]